jgi:asparagine synthase (glutamine-hydrolysing)
MMRWKVEMSGIAGVYVCDGSTADLGILRTMTDAMAYRGPDGISHWAGGSIAMGHCMLRTTSEAACECLPYRDEKSGAVITFAGRLDQREELIALLAAKGVLPATTFDSALVLAAYLAFGVECFNAINGDFAIAVWDNAQRQLVLARDRIGLVPLHYYYADGTVAFASDAHALLRLEFVPKRLNEGVVAEILSDRWQLRGDTLWDGISALRPGTYMLASQTRKTTTRYWPSLAAIPEASDSTDELVSAYRQTLCDTLADCCRSSAPVTFSVSGGLDSSALICLAAELRASGRAPDLSTRACTLNYAETQGNGEIDFARLACREAGVQLDEFVPMGDSAEVLLRDCGEFMAIPGYLAQRKHLQLLRNARSMGSRVFITGEGGDQLIGGQSSHWFELLRRGRWSRFLLATGRAVASHGYRAFLPALSVASSAGLPQGMDNAIREYVRRWRRVRRSYETSALLTPEACRLLAQRAEQHALLDATEGADFRWWPSRDDFYLQGLMNFERLAAAHQLEVRHPYMSARMIELAAVTPKHLKEARGIEKIIHRLALAGTLPDPIRQRNDKSGCDLSVDDELELLLRDFTPAECLPLRRSGLERLRDRFRGRRIKCLESAGNDNWVLQSVWFLSALANSLPTFLSGQRMRAIAEKKMQ